MSTSSFRKGAHALLGGILASCALLMPCCSALNPATPEAFYRSAAAGHYGVLADPDNDGLLEAADHCPTVAEDFDGFEDADGCIDVDNDGDGLCDASVAESGWVSEECSGSDQCPLEAEDFDDFDDTDGCPDNDNDGDGVKDGDDECPAQAELINGVDDFDGCPDDGDSLAWIEGDQIRLAEKIKYDVDKYTIRPESYDVLKQVATIMVLHEELEIRIEGHLSDSGAQKYGMKLCERRARAAMNYLTNEGVPRERMRAIGYGEDRPIESNKTKEGRAANRRVEFWILPPSP